MDLVKVQSAVDQVDREIAGLSSLHGSALGLAWSRLVTVLALEPPRATRACPRCAEVGMRDATVCGYCWLKLVPPTEAIPAAHPLRGSP